MSETLLNEQIKFKKHFFLKLNDRNRWFNSFEKWRHHIEETWLCMKRIMDKLTA